MMNVFHVLSTDGLTLWALNVFLQVTVVASVALLVARLIVNNAALKWWTLGVALVLVMLSPITAWISQKSHVGWLAVQAPAAQTTAKVRATSSGVPAPQQTHPVGEAQTAWPLPSVTSTASVTSGSSPINTSAPAITAAAQPSAMTLERILRSAISLLIAVWATGCLWMLIRMARSWRNLRHICRDASIIDNETLTTKLTTICRQLHVTQTPRLLQSQNVHSPVAAGIAEPAILLPTSLLQTLSTDQLHDILLHEVAHIARHDQQIIVAQHLVSCLFWCHPLVRILNRQFAQAREEVCDNYVLQTTEAPDYSRTLLELAQSAVPSTQHFDTAVGVLDHWSLESRVKGLLNRGRNCATGLTGGHTTIVSLLFGIMLVIGSIATVSVASDNDDDVVIDRPIGTRTPARKETTTPADKQETQSKTPQRHEASADSKALPQSTEFHFSGRVIDPQGKSVAGAKIYFARPNARPLAVSDQDGRFEFSQKKSQLPNNAAWGHIRLTAVAEGFGIAISPALRFEDTGKGRIDLIGRNPNKKFGDRTPPPILKLVKDDLPINGQIVDLEGQPVPNVSIQLRFVANVYARFAFEAVTTDADGRFQISGIGSDRTVRLVAKGTNTAFSVFFARTKNMTPVTNTTPDTSGPFDEPGRNDSRHKVIYGAQLTHSVEPSIPVTGRITDRRTKQPLVGVTVYAYELPNNSEIAKREEFHTVTDKDGRYRLLGLPFGQSRLMAESSDRSYLPAATAVSMKDDVREIRHDLEMTQGLILKGQAIHKVTRAPVPGFINYSAMQGNKNLPVEQRSARSGAFHQYQTDELGYFEIPVLPGKGFVAFRSRSHGDHFPLGVLSPAATEQHRAGQPFLPTQPNLMMPTSHHAIEFINPPADAREVTATFELQDAPDVTVSFVDADNNPVPGVTVEEMLTYNGTGRGNSVEIKGSTYTARYFTPDQRTVIIGRHAQRNLIGKLDITELRDAKHTVTLQAAAKITGRIVDEEGQPRTVRLDGNGYIIATDDNGRFEWPMVIPGESISAQAIDSKQFRILGIAFEDITVAAGQTRDLGDIVIQPIQ